MDKDRHTIEKSERKATAAQIDDAYRALSSSFRTVREHAKPTKGTLLASWYRTLTGGWKLAAAARKTMLAKRG